MKILRKANPLFHIAAFPFASPSLILQYTALLGEASSLIELELWARVRIEALPHCPLAKLQTRGHWSRRGPPVKA